jgi:hypothetical protein
MENPDVKIKFPDGTTMDVLAWTRNLKLFGVLDQEMKGVEITLVF